MSKRVTLKKEGSAAEAGSVCLIGTAEHGSIAGAFEHYLYRGKRCLTLLVTDPVRTAEAFLQESFKTADVVLVDGLSGVAPLHQEKVFALLEGCGKDVVVIEPQIQRIDPQLLRGKAAVAFKDFFKSRCPYDTQF